MLSFLDFLNEENIQEASVKELSSVFKFRHLNIIEEFLEEQNIVPHKFDFYNVEEFENIPELYNAYAFVKMNNNTLVIIGFSSKKSYFIAYNEFTPTQKIKPKEVLAKAKELVVLSVPSSINILATYLKIRDNWKIM